MALRWTAAAMHEAKKGFRRLKAFKRPYEPPLLRTTKRKTTTLLPKRPRPLNVIHGSVLIGKKTHSAGSNRVLSTHSAQSAQEEEGRPLRRLYARRSRRRISWKCPSATSIGGQHEVISH